MTKFQVGDRIKASANNAYVLLNDQTIRVGTTGTILDVDVMEGEPDFYRVDWDAEWVGIAVRAADDHPILNCYDYELEAAE